MNFCAATRSWRDSSANGRELYAIIGFYSSPSLRRVWGGSAVVAALVVPVLVAARNRLLCTWGTICRVLVCSLSFAVPCGRTGCMTAFARISSSIATG